MSEGQGARQLALSILALVGPDGMYVDEAIQRTLSGASLDPRDRALVMELVHGVLRHRMALDWRLDQVASRKMAKLPPLVADILRLGAYQVLHLTKIPHRAAVHEAVALARRRIDAPHWPGFVNAVLRALLRSPTPPWPSRTESPVQSLAIQYSCPVWLVARWIRQWGAEGAERLCRQACEEPPLTVRVNQLRMSREAVRAAWAAVGVEAVPTGYSPTGLHVVQAGSPAQLPGYREGWFYVEDEAAHLIPGILAPEQGERVLDACAAPGGKALHSAELMHARGEIVAVDRGESRLSVLRANCARLGIAMVTPVAYQWAPVGQGAALPAPLRALFDRVLLDAPCSALGVLRRHPEGKWQKQEAQLVDHQRTQRQLLETVSRLLRPGGVIVYSTCSTEPEETLQVIDHFCEAHREFVRESVAPWLPAAALPLVTERGELCTVPASRGGDVDGESSLGRTAPMDAFFVARLTRRAG